ncbi:MFS transporter [Dictyobacter kobayashii]|uniref:MFS transporter n=1 Tax=Dictyobacter kobayashii TaxID=2014872 RepID=A0A402ARJ7_9CHLR|nr:MFS transporter [Dictyobacter kobayashii]GCE21719.1 MFS transporter [Dictyobacter kobayashii]
MLEFSGRIRLLRAFKYRPFTYLWIGQTISSLGDGAYTTALAWLILVLTGSATAMGIVVTANALPRVLFLLLGGVVADRLPRRLMMLLSDGSRAVIVLLIALLSWTHQLQLWHLVVLSLFFGIVDGFFIPAYQSIPAQLVPRDDLPSANALNELSLRFSQFVGPLLGAACVALVGPGSAFGLDGLSFVLSTLCLLAMRLPARLLEPAPLAPETNIGRQQELNVAQAAEAEAERQGVRGVFSDMRAGLDYVLGSTWLWVSIVISAGGNVFSGAALEVALPKLISSVYGSGVWLLGMLASASAIGSIVAVLIVGQLKQINGRGLKMYFFSIISGLALALMGWPLPRGSEPLVAGIASVFIGFSMGFFNVNWFIILQQMIPDKFLGRVSSIDMMGSLCLTPVGLALGGIITDSIGPAWSLLAVASSSPC